METDITHRSLYFMALCYICLYNYIYLILSWIIILKEFYPINYDASFVKMNKKVIIEPNVKIETGCDHL